MKAGIALVLSMGCAIAVACGGGGDGGGNAACKGVIQQLAGPVCDLGARTCQEQAVPDDEAACDECLVRAQELGNVTPLSECTCKFCAGPLGACFQSGNADRDALCRAIVECGQASGCQGTDCYCGTGVSIADCLMNGPMGPCIAQIDAAAAASDGCMPMDAACVAGAQTNLDSAVARANAVGACSTGNPTAMPPAVGNCAGVPNQ